MLLGEEALAKAEQLAKAWEMTPEQVNAVYTIIGRTDGFGGETGSLILPADLSARIAKEMIWRHQKEPLRLSRSGSLEIQGEGVWLEGWSREGLYNLLGLEPWREG